MKEKKNNVRRFHLATKKRFEKLSAGNRSEFDEHFAFLIENDREIDDIAQNGYQTVETSFNVLGKTFLHIVLKLRKQNAIEFFSVL